MTDSAPGRTARRCRQRPGRVAAADGELLAQGEILQGQLGGVRDDGAEKQEDDSVGTDPLREEERAQVETYQMVTGFTRNRC